MKKTLELGRGLSRLGRRGYLHAHEKAYPSYKWIAMEHDSPLKGQKFSIQLLHSITKDYGVWLELEYGLFPKVLNHGNLVVLKTCSLVKISHSITLSKNY